MRFRFFSFFSFVTLGSFFLSGVGVHAQTSTDAEQIVSANVGESIALEWRVDAAERALRSGLIGLAESGFRAALASPSLASNRADYIRLRLVAALIAQERYRAASAELAAVSEEGRGSPYYLYLAIATYGDGRSVEAATFAAALKEVKAVELDKYDAPWWHLARGLRAELAGKDKEVIPAFEKAVAAAQSDSQKAFFRSLVFRQKMFETPSDEGLAAELREQLDRLSGDAAAFNYARQYAIILNNLGRSEEAIGVIDVQRDSNKALRNREREQLLLLKGVIAGQNTARGREALQALVRSGKTREVMRVALHLLAQDQDAAAGLKDFLAQMDKRAEPHLLLSEIYYLRSQLALARAEAALREGDGQTPNLELAQLETTAAETDAKYLLEQFPGFQQITNVYRLLAFAALQRTQPQYRAAADFLIQLRDQTEAVSERIVLNRLIGDCYFLNGDYANAVDFYQAAHARAIGNGSDDSLFLRLVTAEVRSGQMESALQHIDEADFRGSVSVSERWRAEWNVAQALKAEGQIEVALTRVRLLVEGSLSGIPPNPSLDIRLLWLEAYLTFLMGGDDSLLERVSGLLARVESLPEGSLQGSEAQLLVTEILLLQAQEYIRSGNAGEGVAVLERIRVGYGESSAAQRSYLTEADYHASINDFEAAQKTLEKLATLYSASNLAPQAIFEAAIYCERRGPEYFEQAVLLHEQIAEDYPLDDLVYSARLKQGDLLRKLNEFADAQILYENLINDNPTHPRRYIPELSRVDCMLALAKDNEGQLADIVLALERLMDVPNLPIDFQAEIGYKWGFTLLKRDMPEKAEEAFFLIYDRFLQDSKQAVQLGLSGRYWMSRTTLALGNVLEVSGELTEAHNVYRKMVAFNLPGRNLALDRANRIQVLMEAGAQ
jgi:tetratricopeptide (TPR) repeat protein